MLTILFFVFISALSLIFTYKISKNFNLYDLPNKLKIHENKIPNIAGLGLMPIAISIILINELNSKIIITFVLFIIVILIGIIDDIKNIKPQLKILFLLIPILVFTHTVYEVSSLGDYKGVVINLGSLSFLFTVLCLLLLTNSFNYIDGIDGLLSLNLIITFSYFIFINYEMVILVLPIICFLIIYTFFNINFLKLFPKQFLGDSGSLALGFLVSTFLIILTQGESNIHPAVIIWPVAFVVYEFLTINILRIKLKQNIFKRDLNFIFNILNEKYNLKISLLLCNFLHLIFCIIGLIVYKNNLHFLSIVLFTTFFIIYCYLRLKLFVQSKNIKN